ncbi:MAG: lysine--tRNA ligase [Alphaproteobacteria bacterium]|nr:MAG: lysine--tRNA ligase [Alphaproteobacteria bacterium]
MNDLKSWPFVEARKILERIGHKTPEKGYVLLETGYGPSGLPHIGTFAEVLRTTMVKNAFSQLSDIPVKIFCVSDDMDGFRKVPLNVPNQEMLQKHLNQPLTKVPDPYETYESFAHHNNARLQGFLNHFGFEYEFVSSTAEYQKGTYNETLRQILEHYDDIMKVMLPTLGPDRQKTYSPFLPICPRTGAVLQVKAESVDTEAYTMTYKDPETQELVTVSVLNGACKLQWKIDWPMRWMAFDVDFEMYGKDLIDSVTIGRKICKILKKNPPAGDFVELFLDEDGQKISKSKGKGFTMEDWLKYGPQESLSYYIYQNPKRAKRLFFDVIPRATDEYMSFMIKYQDAPTPDNPVWHVHYTHPPKQTCDLPFTLLLNLVSVSGSDDAEIIWGFVQKNQPHIIRTEFIKRLVKHAIAYYKDFVHKDYRAPTSQEKEALKDLIGELQNINEGTDAKDIQHIVFEVGKRNGFTDLKAWFGSLYEILLGQKEGPRMGSFIALYGLKETVRLIEEKISATSS